MNLYSDALPTPAGAIESAAVYVLVGGHEQPQRILHYGQIRQNIDGDRLGHVTLQGVQAEDRARVFVETYGNGQRYSYPPSDGEDSELYDGLFAYADPQEWNYELDHRFVSVDGRITTLSLTLQSDDINAPPIAQLCAMDVATGCHSDWHQEMNFDGTYWHALFTPLPDTDELPRYLIARILEPSKGVKGGNYPGIACAWWCRSRPC